MLPLAIEGLTFVKF